MANEQTSSPMSPEAHTPATAILIESQGPRGSQDSDYMFPWWLRVIFGVLWIILGTVAISMPIAVTFAASLFFGWVLFFGGVFQSIYAFFNWREGGMLQLLMGVLQLVFGLLLINNLAAGAITFTALIGMFFLIQGVLGLVVAFKEKVHMALFIFTGVLSLIFGFLIFSNLLGTSAFLIGLLLGLQMIFTGFGMIATSTVSSEDAGTFRVVLGIALIVFLIGFFLVRFVDRVEEVQQVEDKLATIAEVMASTVIYPVDGDAALLRQDCSQRGGEFNECGPNMCQITAALQGEPVACTMECVPICQNIPQDANN